MEDLSLNELNAALGPLLRALHTLEHVARHLRPDNFAELAELIGPADTALREAHATMRPWPDAYAGVRHDLDASTDHALGAFAELRVAFTETGDLRGAYRALRRLSRGLAALYPLARLPPVGRYFLEQNFPDGEDRLAHLAQAPASDDTGIIDDGEPGARGGYSLYVPEDYEPSRAWPLVVALHGGAGNGRNFLWSWLRAARSFGAVVVAPTATGATWALTGTDTDTPNILGIVESIRTRWTIDPQRMLLTGMSDGGTFSYVSGLETASPFTHLAPVAAAFHPMLVSFAEPPRLQGLPIRITHGALDWMFPISIARQARRVLAAAGADASLHEIADLSHCYPQEINRDLLAWMSGR
jgi:phospholipase/carboxylesterase